MRKDIFISIIFIILLSGCGPSLTPTIFSTVPISELTTATIAVSETTTSTTISETTAPTTEQIPSEFLIGDTLIFQENFETKMISMDFTQRVNPPNPGKFYTYYEVKDTDKIYLHSVFEVKNLKGNGLRADGVFNVTLLYDEKYNYNSFSAIEDKDGSNFTYTNITQIAPLSKRVLHFLTEVPLEIRDSGKSFSLIISADNKSLIS